MKQIKGILPVLFTICVISLFYIKRFVILKYYPPICNTFFFLTFTISLFTKETVIQKFAKMIDKNLDKRALIYTRKVTYAWSFFTFINLLISIWTISQSDRIWLIYNGCISYILIGLLFIIEYSIRLSLRRRKLL